MRTLALAIAVIVVGGCTRSKAAPTTPSQSASLHAGSGSAEPPADPDRQLGNPANDSGWMQP